MKKLFAYFLLAAVMASSACNILNPNVTDQVYLDNPDAAKSWVNGLRRQLALTMNQVVVSTELVSDNYFNNRTLSSKVFDIPQIDYFDLDVNNLQVHIQRLREMADYGLEKVLPADHSATANDSAEIYFSKAFAHLLSGELFVALPGSSTGPVLTPAGHLDIAIENLDKAIGLTTDVNEKDAYILLKARAWYAKGNAANAVQFATAVSGNKTLLRQAKYDGINGVSNDMQTFLFSSVNNEFAPLPRLDFLDPKYYHTGLASGDQKPVTIAKAEEAALIIAEAQASANELPAARQTLKDMLTEIVALRPVVMLDDSKETRNGGNRTDYPLTAVQVKFDAQDAPRSNYVLDRKAGNVKAYTVSGTMVTAADIDAATDQDAVLYILYRLRQEIFMAEGRRMKDLGIRLPVSQTEQLNNSHVLPEHIKAQIPAFIPLNRGMDDFTYDKDNGIVTMAYDMNKVLVANKLAAEIFPFIHQ
ncbi:tetratricopeptide repeat protein [Chitinophaga sp. XS-30]|uniref:tetratricopeptide repeat protein n=1 Tax=Chitinophaga sp. XS-30 TaxID=2604421 RepID=UPI0011DDC31D|nr:tetratricopeptide repeat protein [Chitinophaga sp. XS-30]QEH43546.1 tetratricopeptide repeat protein [Chitinophaga sp. XS-30]